MDFCSIDISIPFDKPNRNGVMYTKGAIIDALEDLQESEIPVVAAADNNRFYLFVGNVQTVEDLNVDEWRQTITASILVRLKGDVQLEAEQKEKHGHEITKFSIKAINLKGE